MPVLLNEDTEVKINDKVLSNAGEGAIRLYTFPSEVTEVVIQAVFEDVTTTVSDDDKDQLAFVSGTTVHVLEADELSTGKWFGDFAKPGDAINIGGEKPLNGIVVMVNDQWSEKAKKYGKWAGVAAGGLTVLGGLYVAGSTIKAVEQVPTWEVSKGISVVGTTGETLVAGGVVAGGALAGGVVGGTAIAGSSLMKETHKTDQNDIPWALRANPFLCALEGGAESLTSELPPSESVVLYHYNGMGENLQLSASDIAARLKANPKANHLVWRSGFKNWTPAQQVPEIQAFS